MLANMYHGKKKEMGMGGMNMPKLMKKSMPGGGMVSPMEREMGMGGKMDYEMGGKMDMGHGGDLARAIKIFLMKKGGKTKFPDLTGDGKVTFADILKGRLRKKKKSQEYGGKVMQNGGEVVRTERPEDAPDPMRRKGIVFASTSEPMSKEERDRAKRFLQGTNLDTAIRVPDLVYGEDSRGVMDPDIYRKMSPEEFARLRARGVEIGATIDDFYDDFYREGQMRQPLMTEDDPRFVRKVYNIGMGPDRPAEFEYYNQDKGKRLMRRR